MLSSHKQLSQYKDKALVLGEAGDFARINEDGDAIFKTLRVTSSPVLNDEVTTKSYVDTAVSGSGSGDFLANGSIPMTGDLNMGLNDITNALSLTANTVSCSTLSATSLSGEIGTSSQPFITTVGTLTGLTMGGSIDLASNDITAVDLLTANNIVVNTSSAELTTPAQPNITSVGTLTGLTMGGDINLSGNDVDNVGTLTASSLSGLTLTGDIDCNSNDVTDANVVSATTLTGTLSTAAQPNITSVGTLSSLNVIGNLAIDTNTLFVNSSTNQVSFGSQTIPSNVQWHFTGPGGTENKPIMLVRNSATTGSGQHASLIVEARNDANLYLHNTQTDGYTQFKQDGADLKILHGSDESAINEDGVLTCTISSTGIDMNSKIITGLPTPTASSEAASKSYVDGLANPSVVTGSANLSDTSGNDFTMSTSQYNYVQIGPLVHIDISLVWTGKGSPTTTECRIEIPNNPVPDHKTSFTIGDYTGISAPTTGETLCCYRDIGETQLRLVWISETGTSTRVKIADMATSGYIHLSGTYIST